MNNLYGILKSSNCLSLLYGNSFMVGPSSKSSKEPTFTAKNFLKYCRLFVGPMKLEKPVGLSLVSIIANEPRFKDGIIRRCELPLRSKSTSRSQRVQVRDRKKEVIRKGTDSSVTFQNVALEEKPDKLPELMPIENNDSVSSFPPMVVNDIKSFALLDAKFREDKECLLNETVVMWNEKFIRDIKPTYSGAVTERCIIDQQVDKEEIVAGKLEMEILPVLKQNKSTEVIMSPRPSSSQKRDEVAGEEKGAKKKPVMSKLKLKKPEKEMFKKEKERGWRIREAFDIYKAKLASRSTTSTSTHASCPSHCTSEMSTSAAPRHPHAKSVTSTRPLPDVPDSSAERNRRRKDAGKRIRASFESFVARQNHARNLRALREDQGTERDF